MKLSIDCYEVSVKLLIRKSYWDADNGKMDEDVLSDKIQQGVECPIEKIDVVIDDG